MAAVIPQPGVRLKQGPAAAASGPLVWGNGGLLRVALPSRPGAARRACRAGSGRSSAARRSLSVSAVKGRVDTQAVDETNFEALPLPRVVFGHQDWRRHKSSGRYFRHLKSTLNSRVVQALGPQVAVMTCIASGVVCWNNLLLGGYLPAWAPLLQLATLPYTLTAGALAFLLVFRTNASYGRFDEALTFMARGRYTCEYPKRAQFLRHLQAFPLTYKHHFVQEGSLEKDLRNFTTLSEKEINSLLSATHRPNFCLQMMSECVGRCTMDPVHHLAMELNFATFADDIGGSERLFKTPIPLSYTRLTSRFLFLYHIFLPFALWDTLGWLTIPVTILHTAVFFCIAEVGVLIENPFPILALDAISTSVRNDIAELVALHEEIRNNLEADDPSMTVLPQEPGFAPQPDPDRDSEWDEDAAGLVDADGVPLR